MGDDHRTLGILLAYYFSGNEVIGGGAFLPPKPVVTSADAGVSNVLPKLLVFELLVEPVLAPNPDEPNAGLGVLEPKPPVGADTLGVDC